MSGRLRRRGWAALLVLVHTTALVACQIDPPDGPIASPTASTARSVADALAPAPVPSLERRDDGWYLTYPERFPLVAVDRVIDGDTFDIRVGGAETLRVRLFGVDTAEQGEPCFAEATGRVASLAGREVRLASDARRQDDFGRHLRYVFTPNGRSLDAALVEEGLATAWRDDGALRDLLVGIELTARASGRGCVWVPS